MVDNEKYDDEYQFVDPDIGMTDPLDYTPTSDDASQASTGQSVVDKTFVGKSGVIRNALIVVVLVIAVMVIYPFVHSSFSVQKTMPKISAVTPAPKVQESIVPPTPQLVSAPAPDLSAVNTLSSTVNQKLSALEISQERMQTDVVSTNNQLNGINTNINDMMAKVTELNRIMALYATKVDEQSRVIAQLTAEAAALKKARTARVVPHKMTVPSLTYYIQAVIPGRAWLIASNGSTLTVREGTRIAGLGMVRLIDPRQGRVVISSGQVIRFSQEDS